MQRVWYGTGLVLVVAGALALSTTAQSASEHPGKAPSIEGTYRLVSRVLPDGTTKTAPDVMGMLTYTKEERNMKYMVTWKIPPATYKEAAESFLASGAPAPSGVKSLGRWHAPGSMCGWELLEGEDATAIAQHMAQWARLLELQVTPVVEDAEAASGLSKVYGT